MIRLMFLFAVSLFCFIQLAAGQSGSILLTFSAQNEQVPVVLDSILIENLTTGKDTILFKPNTSILIYNSPSSIDEDNLLIDNTDFAVSSNYPNPFDARSDFQILITKPQTIEISIFNVAGRCLSTYSNHLVTGNHTFSFYPGQENIYFCLIRGERKSKGFKMICSGNSNIDVCKIMHESYDLEPDHVKSVTSVKNFKFMPGDQLRYTGFAKTLSGVNGSEVLEDSPVLSSTYTFNIKAGIPCREIPVIEYEGKTYHTVKIGHQCWMKENLDAGKKIWAGLWQSDNDTIEKYCYNNDPLLCDIYGGLYQWNEMMNYKEDQQTQGICPDGWHIPSASDWGVLNSATGGYDSAGIHLKEAGNDHWEFYFDTYSDNSSGFTALPGGQRIHSQYFDFIGQDGIFWSSTKSYSPYSLVEAMSYQFLGSGFGDGTQHYGYSVRCILNSNSLPNVITSNASNISDTSAFSGGEVIDEGSAPVIARGVCWSTNDTPTIAGPHTTNGTGPGAFSSFMQFLQPGTTYYYCAYASNQFGTSYGIIDDFTTVVVELPVVATWSATEITDSSAVGNGYIHDDGNGIILEKGICWGTNPDPTVEGLHAYDTTNTIIYHIAISGLSPNTIYYFRAFARNKAGLDYGMNVQIVTKSGSDNTIPCPGIPTITYGGQLYHTVQAGDQCWLKENLNVGAYISDEINSSNNGIIEKYCYYEMIENCNKYGGLYRWNEAMDYQTQEGSKGICPEGWHLPDNNDWNVLAEFVGGLPIAGGALKETGTNNWLFPNTGATDSVGFSALPGGHRLPYDHFEYGWYMGAGEMSFYWSSSLNSQNQFPFDWIMSHEIMEIYSTSLNHPDYGFSIRCIKD